jgi:hypothetical protein
VNRSTIVYVLMVGVFAAGLWLILGPGAALLPPPPPDMAGDWELTPLPGTAGDIQTLRVEQSGRFFKLTFHYPIGPSLQMKLIEQSPTNLVRLSGSEGQITFSASEDAERWRLAAVGRWQGTWNARLVNRTYPRSKSTTRPQSAPASANAR